MFIGINSFYYTRVRVRNSRFENHVNRSPVDSIRNLYFSSLMVRGPRYLPNMTIDSVVEIVNTTFYNNERGLTLIGILAKTLVINCTFDTNVAMHAGAGVLYLTESEDNTIDNCVFINNRAGSYRQTQVDEYSESFVVEMDEARIDSDCCHGVMRLVGKGGAIRVQVGNLLVRNSQFFNNSARLLGGAIFVERKAKLEIQDVLIEDTQPLVYQTLGVLLYSNGVMVVRRSKLRLGYATESVSILRHTGVHWSFTVHDIEIICPVGYSLRPTNHSTYMVKGAGILQSHSFDQVSYHCDPCSRHKYSLDYGYLNFSIVYKDPTYYTLWTNGTSDEIGRAHV